IAVRQIQAADRDSIDLRLDVTAVGVPGIAREHAADFRRVAAAREYRHAVPALLAMPDHPVAGGANRQLGEFLLGCFQFLETNDIGRALIEPAQEVRQARRNAIDVVGDDPHRSPMVAKRSLTQGRLAAAAGAPTEGFAGLTARRAPAPLPRSGAGRRTGELF